MNTNVQIQADDLLNDLHEQLSAANGRAAYLSAENKALVRVVDQLEARIAELQSQLTGQQVVDGEIDNG